MKSMLAIFFLLYFTLAQADSAKHSHDDRTHTHKLPTVGLSHNHNGGGLGKSAELRKKEDNTVNKALAPGVIGRWITIPTNDKGEKYRVDFDIYKLAESEKSGVLKFHNPYLCYVDIVFSFKEGNTYYFNGLNDNWGGRSFGDMRFKACMDGQKNTFTVKVEPLGISVTSKYSGKKSVTYPLFKKYEEKNTVDKTLAPNVIGNWRTIPTNDKGEKYRVDFDISKLAESEKSGVLKFHNPYLCYVDFVFSFKEGNTYYFNGLNDNWGGRSFGDMRFKACMDGQKNTFTVKSEPLGISVTSKFSDKKSVTYPLFKKY